MSTAVLWLGFYAASAQQTTQKQSNQLQPDISPVTMQHVMVPMSDGIKLSVYLYFPPGQGPWPVLFEQRYSDITVPSSRRNYASLAMRGYVVAAENFRGTHLSEGTYVGYRALGFGEHRDGYDSVAWLAKQSWSTGKIGSWGGSQAGYAQNFLAVTQPPALLAQFMTDTGLSLFHLGYRRGGTTRPMNFADARDPKDAINLIQEMFRHPVYDDFWKLEDAARHFDKMNLPTFTLGSWYDYMNMGSIESYIGRQHHGGPGSRSKQKLVLGPWTHGGVHSQSNKVGEIEYPQNSIFPVREHMVRWFDHYLKGVENGVERDPVVRYYTTGATGQGEKEVPGNEWKTSADWAPRAWETGYYLTPAASGPGGGLSTEAPKGSLTTTYSSDPANPAAIAGRSFATDARPFEKHPDVRTFTTEPLTAAVEWTGRVKAELFVSSTARDADFIVRVCDVYPDGRSIFLMDNVRRARFREAWDREVLMKPGEIHKIAFDVGNLSHVFNRGHRIRISVSSTGAPSYYPNPQTGEPFTAEPPQKTATATMTVYHSGSRASRIIAPVVGEKIARR